MCTIVQPNDRCSIRLSQHTLRKSKVHSAGPLLILTPRERNKDRITHSAQQDANMIISWSRRSGVTRRYMEHYSRVQNKFRMSRRAARFVHLSEHDRNQPQSDRIRFEKIPACEYSNRLADIHSLVKWNLIWARAALSGWWHCVRVRWPNKWPVMWRKANETETNCWRRCFAVFWGRTPPNKWYPAVDYSSGSFSRNAIFPSQSATKPG